MSNPLFFGHSEHGGEHLHELELSSYPTDVRLCGVDGVKEYLARTKPIRGIITSLFVTCVKPYKGSQQRYYMSVD